MASRSLGPFPKTLRWHEILAGQGLGRSDSDRLIARLLSACDAHRLDEPTLGAVTLLVALPISTRAQDPPRILEQYGFAVRGARPEDVLPALNACAPTPCLAHRALEATLREAQSRSDLEVGLLYGGRWATWSAYDGVRFCDLARRFYANFTGELFEQVLGLEGLPADPDSLNRLAWEMSVITRSFSARWFNACARAAFPESGSIRWYLGHCLGKLDLELSRELSDWEEPLGNPWKRRRGGREMAPSLPF